MMPCYHFITIGRLSNNDGDGDKNGKKSDSHKISHVYVVVNFLCQVIFIFLLFQLH